jgi:hypothetical protein
MPAGRPESTRQPSLEATQREVVGICHADSERRRTVCGQPRCAAIPGCAWCRAPVPGLSMLGHCGASFRRLGSLHRTLSRSLAPGLSMLTVHVAWPSLFLLPGRALCLVGRRKPTRRFVVHALHRRSNTRCWIGGQRTSWCAPLLPNPFVQFQQACVVCARVAGNFLCGAPPCFTRHSSGRVCLSLRHLGFRE